MLREREPTTVAFALLGVAIAYWFPAFVDPFATGFGDWQMIHHNWEAGYVALTRHGEWPLWDPYHCGGITMWGNPEAQHLSPFFFLSLLTGTTLAIKIMVVVHAWAGLVGMYLLARRCFHLQPPAALFASLAWGCSGFWVWQIGGGHGTFVPFYLAPWVLLAWRAAVADWRMSAALAALMALVAFEGGTYPFPYFVLLLCFDAAVLLVRGRRRAGVVVAALVSGGLTMLLSAVRWVPSLITLSRIPRDADIPDVVAPWEIPEMLARPWFPWVHPDHPFVWPEYSAYIGAAGLLVGLAGIHAAIHHRRWEPLAGTVVFGTLMAGQFADWAPWSLIHELPVYRSLRVPSRFSVLFTLYFVLIGAIAVDTWLPRLLSWRPLQRIAQTRPRLAPMLPWLAVAALVLDPFIYGISHNAYRWRYPPIEAEEVADRFHLVHGSDYRLIYASLPRRNQGTPACYVGNLDWAISKHLWLRDRPQARVRGKAGKVLSAGRTPNTAWAEVEMREPADVIFNQNHDPDWQTHVGDVRESDGRLAVALPEGHHRIVMRYEPPRFRGSVFLTGAGGFLAFLLAWAVGRRRFGTAAPSRERRGSST